MGSDRRIFSAPSRSRSHRQWSRFFVFIQPRAPEAVTAGLDLRPLLFTTAQADDLRVGVVFSTCALALLVALLIWAVRRASESPPKLTGLRAAQWSFVLAVPAWTLVVLTKLFPPRADMPGYLEIIAALALLPAGVLGLVGVGIAVVPSRLDATKRWAAGVLSLPALVAIAIGFYVFATWNPGE